MSIRPEPKTFTSSKLDLLDAMSMDPRVTDGEFRTAFRLAQHANAETGAIFPSQGRLADQMGKKERTVRSCIAGLVQKGWLAIWRPNKRAPNSYRFDGRHINDILDRQAMLNEARREARISAEPLPHDRQISAGQTVMTGKPLPHDRQISAGQTVMTGKPLPLVTGKYLPVNTLREHLKDKHLKEGKEPIKVSTAPSYGEREDDPHLPFPVPRDETELATMLGQLFAGCQLSTGIMSAMRKMLMAGKLTPAMVEEQRRFAS